MSSDERGVLRRWLRVRLIEGERPKEEWRELWEATWDHVLALPLHDLVDADTAKALANRFVDPDLVTELSRPIVAEVAGAVIAELREDARPLDRFLPVEAQQRLREALARPGLVHPDWVRAMFRGEAAEAVLNDALYRALKEFSTLLPRLLVKLSPMGRMGVLGGAGVFAEKLIEEMEKRIEPEIKSFLADSTERVLARAAEFTIAKLDDPASIEFRSDFIEFVLSKSPAFFLEAVDDELIGDMGAIVELSARHAAEMPEMRADIDRWIDRALEHSAGKTVGEALQIQGSGPQLPIDVLAKATWPAFRAVLTSPRAQSWMDALLDELIEEYDRIMR